MQKGREWINAKHISSGKVSGRPSIFFTDLGRSSQNTK